LEGIFLMNLLLKLASDVAKLHSVSRIQCYQNGKW
jgi:hypothetical protein